MDCPGGEVRAFVADERPTRSNEQFDTAAGEAAGRNCQTVADRLHRTNSGADLGTTPGSTWPPATVARMRGQTSPRATDEAPDLRR